MRKFFKKLHKWLSIPVGLIIFIICLTGCILTFEKEILEWVYPERYFVEVVGEKTMPLNELVLKANEQLKDNSVAGITVSSDSKRTYTISLKEGFRSSAFIDPYTGKVTGIYNYQEGFFYKMMTLHRWLMDGSRTWGKYTVGITTIIFVIILISGIFIWIPKEKKKLKSRFTISVKRGWRRFFYDIHIVLGFYACLLLIMCCLTGLMWSFDWYRNGVYVLFGIEVSKEDGGGHGGRGGRGGKEGKEKPLNVICWDDVLAQLKNKEPEFKTISIQDGSATVLSLNAPHNRATDQYKFDARTGNIQKKIAYEETPESRRAMLWAYNLHVGAYGGIWTRILTCIVSFIGASLPITGYYIWFKKGGVKRRKKK